ncbi:MAG: serine hydrolase domain-containing protein [Anaerolineae bacterium]
MSSLMQNRYDDAIKLIEPLFRQRAEVAHIPGVAYGVVANGELVGVNSFGVRENVSNSSAESDTVFRIASMTKSFCAAAILQLRDANKLRLDDLVVSHVPDLHDLNYPTADSPPLTIRHLLTMTAGIPQDDPWADRQLYRTDQAMSGFYQQGATFSAPPATRFEYSNYGYMLLGRIITNVSGQPAMQYVTDHLLKPLGMHATVWNASDVPADKLAHGYVWLDEAWQEDEMLVSGGDNVLFAGIFTTVADLGKWVNFFLSAWPPRDEADNLILKRSSLREMQQPWSLISTSIKPYELGQSPELSTGHYGYGLFINHNGRYSTVGHGGGLPGFGSYMCWSPEHNIGIIALGNERYGGFSQACLAAINLLIEQLEIVVPKSVPSADLSQAYQVVSQLVVGWDDALADTLFADNFFLDLDRPHWQAKLSKLRQKHGKFEQVQEQEIEAEDWLRGRWRLPAENGWCDLFISMTPTVPPLVQKLTIKSVMPLSADMQQVAQRLAELVTRPILADLDELRSSDSNRGTMWKKIRLVNLMCGACFAGDILESDGECRAVLLFNGDKANTRVVLGLDQSGKMAKVRFLNAE